MPAKVIVIGVTIVVALFLAGCGLQPGSKLIAYNAGSTGLPSPSTATVDKAGTYGLFPGDGINPLDKVELKHGDIVGFRRGNDGQIVGFAEEREFNLTAILASEYAWKYLGNGEK